jgi:nucleolar protein 58
LIGYRTAAAELDLSDILPTDVEAQVKEAAEISMGTEISEEDITNIRHLCSQVGLIEWFRMRKT